MQRANWAETDEQKKQSKLVRNEKEKLKPEIKALNKSLKDRQMQIFILYSLFAYWAILEAYGLL